MKHAKREFQSFKTYKRNITQQNNKAAMSKAKFIKKPRKPYQSKPKCKE